MNFITAQDLAASTLAAFKFTTNKGREQPDATTTLARNIYDGPRGRGWEVAVTLKGKVQDLRIIRHFGPEAARAKPDPTFADAQSAALATLAKQPHRTLTAERIRAATTLDGLLYNAAAALEEAQFTARAKAKAKRDELPSAGFTFAGKLIQTRNQVDIDNINGATLRATNDPTFTTGWICADNSILGLDAPAIIQMQAAMISRGNAIFTAYVTLAGQIAACATVAEVEALPALAP